MTARRMMTYPDRDGASLNKALHAVVDGLLDEIEIWLKKPRAFQLGVPPHGRPRRSMADHVDPLHYIAPISGLQ